jgi:hypothetical protein
MGRGPSGTDFFAEFLVGRAGRALLQFLGSHYWWSPAVIVADVR